MEKIISFERFVEMAWDFVACGSNFLNGLDNRLKAMVILAGTWLDSALTCKSYNMLSESEFDKAISGNIKAFYDDYVKAVRG